MRDLDPATAAPALGLAQTFFAQGAEMLRNPGRSGGWDQVDVGLLQGIGRMSMSVAAAVAVAARQMPGLAARLDGPVQILDVGTGVGWLAVALARAYPQARVLGIDIFPPALDLARGERRRRYDVADRVELRAVRTSSSSEPDPVFEVAWLPLPFLPGGHRARRARRRTRRARTRTAGCWPAPSRAGGPDRLAEAADGSADGPLRRTALEADELVPLLSTRVRRRHRGPAFLERPRRSISYVGRRQARVTTP